MKKVVVVMVVVFLMGLLLSAAAPASKSSQLLRGTLLWQRQTSCQAQYFVSNEAMDNVFLTGKFLQNGNISGPGGTFAGCHVDASGFYYRVGQCTYFNVDKYQLACPTQ